MKFNQTTLTLSTMNTNTNNNKKKLWLIATLMLLIVVLVVLVATRMHKPKNSGVNHSHTIHSICNLTDYKQACLTTMKSLAHKHTMSPKDVLNATIYAVIHAVTNAGPLLIANNVDANDQALDICNELLGYALDDLHSSLTIVEKHDLQTLLREKKPDLMNWLSAVVAYQETCLDGFNDRVELRESMSKVLLNATQLIFNALAIVADMPNISKIFNIPTVNGTGRRLLGTDESRYPVWMSVADRRLLAGGNVGLTPNAVVAKDGSGQFKIITDALAAYPKGNKGRYVVYVKEGIYDEHVIVTKDHINVFMYGDGATKTIVTGNRSNKTGWKTFKSASFSALGSGFIAKSMGFQNSAGPAANQAVALLSKSDKSAFYDVQITGYQDTLYTHCQRQFYTNCTISGTVDFIFGFGTVIIQDCKIISKLPDPGKETTITAHGRKSPRETTGIVIQHCDIVADEKLFPVRSQVKSYLGRPWKKYSRTVVMESNVDDFIQSDGWLPWDGDFASLDTCFYAEYANVGPGAITDKRVKGKGVKVITDRNEAIMFTAGAFIKGNEWLTETGAPFYLGLKS